MQFEPTLIVTRLVVERHGLVAYDQKFHAGVNIIRGENSSGKSTVLNFIFYGLGGDLSDWSEIALLCTRVVLEARVNGKFATLSRDISSESMAPMDIFGGDYESSRTAPGAEWIRYPYRRSATRESFSQALFRLLDIPEVSSDVTGNLTMHQVMRLVYADQLSPVESLLRFEHFDPPALRDAIARLLCGAFDSELYNNEQRIRTLDKQFDAVEAELKSLFAVLGRTSEPLTLDWIAKQRQVLKEKQDRLRGAIEVAERETFARDVDDQYTLAAQEAAYADVQRLQEEISTARQQRDGALLAIADSAAFIKSLEFKLEALRDSSAVSEGLGQVQFKMCPSCYAVIDDEASVDACHLCKTPFDSARAKNRIVGLINETALQLKQSRTLQEDRERQVTQLAQRATAIEEEWNRASRRLAELQRLPSTALREQLRSLHRDSGYLAREQEELESKGQLVELVDSLSNQKNALSDAIQRLRTRNEQLRYSQERWLAQAYTAIADEVRTLLHNDLPRESAFQVARSVEFDFIANKISIDGQTYFSASSRVILKSSFFLAFLAAATKLEFFRHPRFCMLDTIEDKGMEPARSQNFQSQIVRISEESQVEHQIVFATSMIAPQLDNDDYVIGEFSTHDARTLKIG